MNEINEHLQMVRLFHDAFSYTQAPHNSTEAVVMSDKTRFGRMSFLTEELSEILSGVAAEDRVAQLDGVVDLSYFTLGTLAVIGENVQAPDAGFSFKLGKVACLKALVDAVSKVTHVLSFYAEEAARADLPGVLSYLHACCRNFCEQYIHADFDGAFTEVQRSNMSKLGASGMPIYNKAGKIGKGPNFSEPVLPPFLEEIA